MRPVPEQKNEECNETKRAKSEAIDRPAIDQVLSLDLFTIVQQNPTFIYFQLKI